MASLLSPAPRATVSTSPPASNPLHAAMPPPSSTPPPDKRRKLGNTQAALNQYNAMMHKKNDLDIAAHRRYQDMLSQKSPFVQPVAKINITPRYPRAYQPPPPSTTSPVSIDPSCTAAPTLPAWPGEPGNHNTAQFEPNPDILVDEGLSVSLMSQAVGYGVPSTTGYERIKIQLKPVVSKLLVMTWLQSKKPGRSALDADLINLDDIRNQAPELFDSTAMMCHVLPRFERGRRPEGGGPLVNFKDLASLRRCFVHGRHWTHTMPRPQTGNIDSLSRPAKPCTHVSLLTFIYMLIMGGDIGPSGLAHYTLHRMMMCEADFIQREKNARGKIGLDSMTAMESCSTFTGLKRKAHHISE